MRRTAEVAAARRWSSYAAPGSLALLVTVGAYKPALDFVPVDPTLVSALLVAVAAGAVLVKSQWRITRGTARTIGLFLVLSMGLAGASLDGYSISKASRLFALTLIAILGPMYILRSRQSMARFFHVVAAIGVVIAIQALVSPPEPDLYGRLTSFGSNTLSLGRAMGLPIVWVVLLALHRRISLAWAAVLLAPLLLAMFGAGQRGPLLALMGAVVASFVFAPGARQGWPRRLAVLGLIVGASWFGFAGASDQSTRKLGELAATDRVEAWQRSLGVVLSHPLGVGWGDWGDYVDTLALSSKVPLTRDFPHNLLIEVTTEAGILAGIAIAVFVVRGFRSARRGATMTEGKTILAGLVFALVNAMVSGDINDNRLVWVMLGIVFAHERIGVFQVDEPRRMEPRESAILAVEGDGEGAETSTDAAKVGGAEEPMVPLVGGVHVGMVAPYLLVEPSGRVIVVDGAMGTTTTP